MRYLLSASEMKNCDNGTIERIGIPAMVLMERAALSVVEELLNREPECGNILVVAGKGNNGGDGLAIGRLLARAGKRVTIYMPVKASSTEALLQEKIVKNMGFPICDKWPQEEYDIIIDALLGIGISGELRSPYPEVIRKMNDCRKSGTRVYAVDLPTGIDTDTGKAMTEAVKADVTVTFQYLKRAHMLYPAREYCGDVVVKDVGIEAFGIKKDTAFSYEKCEIEKLLPVRNPAGHKGTFGKVFLYAGSTEISGAAILCARAILATGAGMVKIFTAKENWVPIQTALPEAMLTQNIDEAINWADVIVAGPGIGKSRMAYDTLNRIFNSKPHPMVLDADAINLLAEHMELQELLCEYSRKVQGQVILTPHPMEFVRLIKSSMEQYQMERETLLKITATRLHSAVVSKDAVTMVNEGENLPVYYNSSGNNGMATAGSGDVLTGVIGSLMAQGMSGFDAACTGVFLHGMAGDDAAVKKGTRGMLASDILEELWKYMR